MKSLIAACVILAAVIIAVTLSGMYMHDLTRDMTAAVQSFPESTDGDPADYEIAIQTVYIIWEENRSRIAILVPGRTNEPLERALRSIESGWKSGDDALYRQSLAEVLLAVQRIRDTVGFSLTAVL